ncbi:phosphatase PAP2 family protein [Streptomyces albipurpureus]|uniref:Phosphatase PAP2 family protein n=1 Tax=Streptomyces albipurpureus TaxID=2897419 RepID=A0ABT0UV74_9ACTN|nr:phosphatase PAP2 family protein [Streptomyces sp. CWNU-1]MCM2392340.1 phosphatase PAP2 family protein [Streptomyces sp. CWNU-1]
MRSSRSAPPVHPAHSSSPNNALRSGLALAGLSAVLLVLVALSWSPLISFDRWTANGLHRWAVDEPGLVHVNRVFSDWVWDPWTMRALIAVVFCWLWWKRERLLAVWIAVTAATGTFFQQGLKAALDRDRPTWPDPVDSANYASFPSGHAMTATVTCGLLLWLLRTHGAGATVYRWSLVVAAVSVVGVGLTRLFLGVHWPSDVLAGWLMGLCWVAFSIALYERYERSQRQ